MIYEKVNFRDYGVETKVLFDKLPRYAPFCWPESWVIIPSRSDRLTVVKWLQENATMRYDIVKSNGKLYVALEDETDAVLFKLSIQENA